MLETPFLCKEIQSIMIEEKILQTCCDAIKQLYHQEIKPGQIGFEKTKKEIEGDYTVVVFPLTRLSKKSPEMTAHEIGQFLQLNLSQLEKFSVIKGFLNLTLTDHFWINQLFQEIRDPSFGCFPSQGVRPVVLEYSSPNTNKPLHLGHVRNNLLGSSLASVLTANGYDVIKVNLVNDRGIHICKSLLAYLKWGEGRTPGSTGLKGDHLVGEFYVMFDQHYKNEISSLMEQGMSGEEAARRSSLMMEAQGILRKWEAKDPEIISVWQLMNGWAYEGFDQTYRQLGVEFDKVYYESDTYLLGKKIVLDGLAKNRLVQKSDRSIWVDLTEYGMDEKLLLRGDGTSVYMTQDLGTAVERYEAYMPSRMIYVVGNEQNYHFDVLQKVLNKLAERAGDVIYHLSYGMVELPFGKMKSREGTVVDADDLMEEMIRTAEKTTRELGKVNNFPEDEAHQLFTILGLGALKYFILKVDPKKNMLFDPKESIDFNGNTGPFIQYTYARIQSLLGKARQAGYLLIDQTEPEEAIVSSLPARDLVQQERRIIKILHHYPEVVKQAGEELSPALIANYVYELAKEFNQFYQEIPVLKEEARELVVFRLELTRMTGRVIRLAMELLGIQVPDRM